MSRHSLARVLLFILVGILVWTTVTPAEAKRVRRYSDIVLEDWTICRNGAQLTIGDNTEHVKLVVTSGTRGRTLASVQVRLRLHPHMVWILNDLPDPDVLVIDNPDTDPDAGGVNNEPEPANLDPSDGRPVPMGVTHAATVKVWWRRPAGQTVKLGLGPVDGSTEVRFATYRVDNCVLLPGKWSESFDALTSWLWKFTPFSYGLH